MCKIVDIYSDFFIFRATKKYKATRWSDKVGGKLKKDTLSFWKKERVKKVGRF